MLVVVILACMHQTMVWRMLQAQPTADEVKQEIIQPLVVKVKEEVSMQGSSDVVHGSLGLSLVPAKPSDTMSKRVQKHWRPVLPSLATVQVL